MLNLAKRVTSKLEDGDFRGAVRIACSEDSLAAFNSDTLTALQAKHPTPHPDSIIPTLPSPSQSSTCGGAGNCKRHQIFSCGSAGGPDILRPQHLKDMLSIAGDEDSVFLNSLASFCSMVLEGRVPEAVRPIFFGASLVALQKKSGGVRPIAVGCTLRRLVSKIAGRRVREDMATLLSPRQLGYGVRGGSEAAVHAARKYLNDLPDEHAMVKLDFRNAFNSLRRDKMLEAVRDLAPEIYPLVYSAYSSPSTLHWGDHSIHSSEGIQQGDPLGPLLFCLTIHRHCLQLRSPLTVMYLDDVSLGCPLDDILHDINVIKATEKLGLFLNNSKSEIICVDATVRGTIITALPGALVVDPAEAYLLGSPIGELHSIDTSLQEKSTALSIMGDHFSQPYHQLPLSSE